MEKARKSIRKRRYGSENGLINLTAKFQIVLYRPVYVKLADRRIGSPHVSKDFRSGSFTRIADSSLALVTEPNGSRRRSILVASNPCLAMRDESMDEKLMMTNGCNSEGDPLVA